MDSDESDYVPSVSSTEITSTKPRVKTRRLSQPKAKPAEKAAASPRKQLSSRKRTGSRISPSVPDSPKPEPKTKKQRTRTPPFQMDEAGKEAIRLVDEVVEKLPAEFELNYSKMKPARGPVYGKTDEIPPLHGQKDIPEGHEMCLYGKTFVISGQLESLTRQEATELIKKHGGRVTGSVSSKTTFLVVGHDAGATKCGKAAEVGAKLIDEDGLFSLIRVTAKLSGKSLEPASTKEEMEIDGEPSDPPKDLNVLLGQELWVDKYKPQSTSEVLGNNSTMKFMEEWLIGWRDMHLLGDSDLMDSKASKKALLLSGHPGVGKTTSALLVAKECGFDAIEVNASDSRNKADKIGFKGLAGKTSNKIKALCQNKPVSSDGRPLVLVMDEVDGISGGDRGGVQDLIENIKKSKVPIICICNDKYNRKLISLRNHCAELDFRKPMKVQMVKRLTHICQQEGLVFTSPQAMEALIEQAEGDMRTLIGGLQFIRAQTNTVTWKDIESGRYSVKKNRDISPFAACSWLFSGEAAVKPWRELSDAVFSDMDLIPLLIQENYVNQIPTKARSDKDRIRYLAKAASCLSFAESLNNKVMSEQKWSLMPSIVNIGSLGTSSLMRGRREAFAKGEPNYPRFTSYLGNLSSSNKQQRLLQSTATRMQSTLKISLDGAAVLMDYFPVLKIGMTEPLIRDGSEGMDEVLDLMKTYCIDKEHYDYIMDVTHFKSAKGWAENPLSKIQTKLKAALTRAVNTSAITCYVQPETKTTVGVKRTAQSVEEEASTDAAIKPELGIIVDDIMVKEEPEEEDMDEDKVKEEMKKSGYNLLEPDKKKAKRSKGSNVYRKSKS